MVGHRHEAAPAADRHMIFLSYARDDAVSARQLATELRDAGLPCLLDPTLSHGDVFWREALVARLAPCQLMVALESPAAAASPWVRQERQWFSDRGPVVAVGLQGDHDALRRIDAAYDGPRGRAIARSTDDMQADAGCASQRQAIQAAGQALLHACMQRLRARGPGRSGVRIDGARAWLADGRVELIRLPHSPAGQYIASMPLSNALYREFLADNPACAPPPTWHRHAWRRDDLPVTGISWFEAAACASWLGGRLPSEAAWAWAARGGAAGRTYATSDGTLSPHLAHHGAAFAQGMPASCAEHPPTPEGFHGLCGNTWDWCSDARGMHRVIRGGGWMDGEVFCRADARYRHGPVDQDACVGFRLAMDPSPVE